MNTNEFFKEFKNYLTRYKFDQNEIEAFFFFTKITIFRDLVTIEVSSLSNEDETDIVEYFLQCEGFNVSKNVKYNKIDESNETTVIGTKEITNENI